MWVTPDEAAAHYRISKGHLRDWARKGKIKREIRGPNDSRYWIDDDGASVRQPMPERSTPSVKRERAGGEKSPYYFDESRDRYVFTLPSKPRHPWVVEGEQVRSLVAAYAKDGDDATINQVARTLGWHRRTVVEVLRALGKTHDSLPFTDEHIAGGDEGELVEDLVRRKEERIHIRAERAGWQQTKELAERARAWERFLVETMSRVSVPRIQPRSTPAPQHGKQTVISHATDLHYGKLGWFDGYDQKECRRRLLATTDAMVDRLLRVGSYDRAIVVAGGDWFHVDSMRMTTTKGTPQDVDGSFFSILEGGIDLAVAQIEAWRAVAPRVEVKIVRGNHDYMTTSMLGLYLRAAYRADDAVVIGEPMLDREYLEIGRTLVGLTHGDGVKDEKLPGLMACEAREAWGRTDRRLWLTGHWHSQITTEMHGVLVRHLPSLSGTDAWHYRSGYVGQRQSLAALVLDDDDGLWCEVTQDAK